ncbi:GNAT family N-acetyltransferase [Bacillus sp. NTK071]|uniref:GNAT family N-acetyltransferase n=1 Tax=Bacillus sp. NTK071 TaxID=2802175 RepID=UPI001A8D49EA|nr:GNAT family N-acetyltransferase [Bacillus sp. NTK071]MBN8208124.1 GNAT family N-acetyltransferase [Bacillus sp. NTK071]
MDITIEELQLADARNLFEFEIVNREYFEAMVPSRGDGFYNYECFIEKLGSLLQEQTQGLSSFFLIKNSDGLILGRINIVDIDQFQSLGSIGYRVGKDQAGKGIAQKALKLLIEEMRNQGIKQILAKTTSNNIASQRILEKNGFKKTATSEEEMMMNGQSLKFVHYKRLI